MRKPRYEKVTDLQAAIQSGEVDPDELTGFVCKGELFIRAGTPDDVFTSYYGLTQSCEDICALLGIDDVQHV